MADWSITSIGFPAWTSLPWRIKSGGVYVDQVIPEKYHVSQMQAFADLLLGRDDGENASITDGKRNAHVLDAILLSAKTGNWVRL